MDLNSYLQGEKASSSYLPGIKSKYDPATDTPQKKSSLNSDYNQHHPPGNLLSQEFQEKQKRLQQYGYSKDVLQKNPVLYKKMTNNEGNEYSPGMYSSAKVRHSSIERNSNQAYNNMIYKSTNDLQQNPDDISFSRRRHSQIPPASDMKQRQTPILKPRNNYETKSGMMTLDKSPVMSGRMRINH